jgi:hypothetical protein
MPVSLNGYAHGLLKPPIMSDSKRQEILILLLSLLLGFALRFYTFDQKSLWLDEIYTFQDSRDGFTDQLRFYKDNPSYLHPPLFFLLTHSFYPFTKPERDLRIIPLIFGTLSIPMIYLLARQFSSHIALPCALSLTFMTYHISLSQDGRSYSMLMFFGMAGLYFFMKHLQTSKKWYLLVTALFFSVLFYTSYSAIPFIIFSQALWLYRPDQENRKPSLASFLTLNGFTLLFCLPWVTFIGVHYRGLSLMDPMGTDGSVSLWIIMYRVLNDWASNIPLMIISAVLLILLPLFSNNKRSALLLLGIIVLPVVCLYLYCRYSHIEHFFTSRYFINLFPIFLISVLLSIHAIESNLKRFMGLKFIFTILFIVSNLMILPLYYQSQKQDYRGLVLFLKSHLMPGDKIFDGDRTYTPGILHYFGTYPESRHYAVQVNKFPGEPPGLKKSFCFENHMFTIYYSNTCCTQYMEDGSRLWIVVGKEGAKKVKKNLPCDLKGYFDGSFLNFNKFPTDASMYLFLWDPKSPGGRGIDIPIE